MWDLPAARERRALKAHTAVVTAVVLPPDGETLAMCAADRVVKLLDAATLDVRTTLFGHTAGVNSGQAFSPDGSLLATCGDDRSVLIWGAGAANALPREFTRAGSG